MGNERRLAAIMFTDIAGYTRMAQANESAALELLEEHRRLLRPVFTKYSGTEVKTIGDAFLVEFKSALEAVQCSVEIQRKVEERNAASDPNRVVRVRVGIHVGDVVHEEGDVYGDAVNVASRIEPLATPGGICVSQQVYDNVRNKSDQRFSRLGDIELKNVDLPMGIYRIEMSSRGMLEPTTAPRERVAVLPFVNISPDPNDEFFADGLTEELISKLSEVKGLKVIARTSVMNYKKKEKNVSEIGRELGVGTIIEGSVRKAGNKIRVSVQLIDSKTEEHLWASNYDKELDDIFAIQTDVASRVAGSVARGFFPDVKKKETPDVEAYALYLKAMQLQHEGLERPVRESVELFKKAIERDPYFARAYAGLSVSWQFLAVNGYDEYQLVSSKGEPAARKAIELDPESAEGHSALAWADEILDRFDDSIAEAKEAIRINPNLAEAYLSLGINHASLGRLKEGIAFCARAYELDPLSPRGVAIYAEILGVANESEKQYEVLQRMNEVSPMNPRVVSIFVDYYARKKDYAKAQELLDSGLKISPREPTLLIEQGMLYAMQGKRKEAEDWMQNLAVLSDAPRNYGYLHINAALGNLDAAFAALNVSADLHSWPFLIASKPVFAEMRKDPRYKEFEKKVGLSPK